MKVVGNHTHDAKLPPLLFATDRFPRARVNIYSKPDLLTTIHEILGNSPEFDFIRSTCFGVLFDFLASLCQNSGKLVHAMLTRQLLSKNNYKMWTVYGGHPLRFSLSDFGRVSGLPCGDYPENYDPNLMEKHPQEPDDLWRKIIGDSIHTTTGDLVDELRANPEMTPKRRIQLALITIVDSVLIASAVIHRPTPKYVRMLDEMDSFLSFPWGRESFFRTIITMRPLRNGKHDDPNKVFCDQLLTGSMRVMGFPLILQMVAYRAIPLLAAKLPNISDETPLLEISSEDISRHRPISMDDIIEVENDPKLIVQPMIEVGEKGEPAEEGWGKWDDEVRDRRVKYLKRKLKEGHVFGKGEWWGGNDTEPLIVVKEAIPKGEHIKHVHDRRRVKRSKPAASKLGVRDMPSTSKASSSGGSRRQESVSTENQLEWLMAEMKERCEDIKKLQQQQDEMMRILKGRGAVDTRQRSSQLRKRQNHRRREQSRKKNKTNDGDGNMASLSFEVSLKEGSQLPRDWMEEPNPSPEKVEDRSHESGEMDGLLSPVGKKEGALKRKRSISPSGDEREEKEELKMDDEIEVGRRGSAVGEESKAIGSRDEALQTFDGEAAANMISDKVPPAEIGEAKIAADTKSKHAFADQFLASSPVQTVDVESRSSSGKQSTPGTQRAASVLTSPPRVDEKSPGTVQPMDMSSLPGRAGTNVDTVCISDCSAVSESTRRKPTEVERELALTLLANQSRAPFSVLPTLDVDIWKQFERTLGSCGSVKHLTRMGINNNFLLDLAKSMNWVNTKHIELLMSVLGEKHAELLEKERACIAAPWLMDTIDIKHRSWKSARNKKTYRWDDRLRHFMAAPGKTWIADVDTVYVPMIWLSKHWEGLVIDLKMQWVHILDPDPSWKDDKHVDKIMGPVLEFLPHIIRNLCPSHPSQPAVPAPFTWHRARDVYVNKRSGDCGPVAMKFMEMHALGDPAPHMGGITDGMVDDFRKQYAMDLYKELVLPLYEEGSVGERGLRPSMVSSGLGCSAFTCRQHHNGELQIIDFLVYSFVLPLPHVATTILTYRVFREDGTVLMAGVDRPYGCGDMDDVARMGCYGWDIMDGMSLLAKL
ncbi:unnamed protein product [Thlaspi arvense]|uniref:Ubiquitin-like protease family profile domain-containing protein n=1 Tax=Thlaspi arvense TaxID=13288 RepID=A0AAU9SDT1_THLAR|nr:unnamed protein product [Thlaspi arvense]